MTPHSAKQASVPEFVHAKCSSILLILFISALALTSCGGGQKQEAQEEKKKHHHHHHPNGDETGSEFVAVDSANKMLSSYLLSIDAAHEDTELHCVIVDADTLRAYLALPQVKKLKIMFAHTLDYINSGHGGEECEYDDGALTFVIAGYDSNGNYVFYPSNNQKMVLNHGMPCPANCPKNGSAASDMLIVMPQR